MGKLRGYLHLDRFSALLLFSITVYTVVLSYLSILRHNLFYTTAWDLGIYEQSIWSTVNSGKLFWYTVELPINPNGSFFGIHFCPILFLILPIYKIFQNTATLFILQSFGIALGSIPLYLIGLKELKHPKQALFFSFLYLIYPPLLGVNLFDFHVQAFLPFFFFFAFYCFSTKKFFKYFIFIILALSVIEFVPFIVLFFGLYGLWVGWREIKGSGKVLNRKILFNGTITCSILTICLGVSWYVIARGVIFFFNPTVLPSKNWAQLGDPVHNPLGLLWNTLSNPLQTASVLSSFAVEKVFYIFGVLAPVGFLSFLDLPTLLIGAPWFVAAFLSNYTPYFTAIGYQYVAFVTPFVFISALRGSKKLSALKKRLYSSHRINRLLGVRGKRVFPYFLASLIGFSYALASCQPNISSVIAELNSRSQQHEVALNKILELIPSDASVMTQNDIFPHVSRRMYAYVMWEWNALASMNEINVVNFYLQKPVDYVLIDSKSEWYLSNIEAYTLKLIESGSYGIYSSADCVWLLKKDYSDGQQYLFDNGLSISLYNLSSFESENATVFSIILSLSFDFSTKSPFPTISKDYFSANISGFINVEESGNYAFKIEVDDNAVIYIDDKLVYNSSISGAKGTFELWLNAGKHSISILYTELEGNAFFKLTWKPPGKHDFEEIPYSILFWKPS